MYILDSDEEQADDMSSVVNDENNVASVDSSTLSGALGSIMSSYTADSDVDQVDSNGKLQYFQFILCCGKLFWLCVIH